MVGWTTTLVLLLNQEATAGAANQSSAMGSVIGHVWLAVQSALITTASPSAVPGAMR